MRSQLLVLFLAALMPASLAAAVAIVVAYQEGREAAAVQATGVSKTMTGAVDRELMNATVGLHALATSPSLTSGDIAGFYEQARQVLPYQPGSNVVLTDATGQQLMNTLVPLGRPLPPHGNPEQLRRVFDAGKPAISDLFLGGVTRRPVVSVDVPVVREGRVRYALAMGFLPDRFGAVLAHLQPQPDWVVAVIDRAGVVLARSRAADEYVGKKATPEMLNAIQGRQEGTAETTTLEGTPVIAAFTRSSLTEWTVVVGIPKRTLMAPLERSLAWLLLTTAVLIALGALTAHCLANRISDSIRALIAPAGALGRGESVHVSPLRLAEADEVAMALERAAGVMSLRIAERDEAKQAQKALQAHAERLEHAAHHDPLTGVANRTLFLQRLVSALASCQQQERPLTLFFIDLDDFKNVNDTEGHAVGDDLLRTFAQRLTAGVRETDLVARLGGDEFAVLLDGLSPRQAVPIAESLLHRVSQPYVMGGATLAVSACIGIAAYPECGSTAGDLLEAGDDAMYLAKNSGKRRCAVSAQCRVDEV